MALTMSDLEYLEVREFVERHITKENVGLFGRLHLKRVVMHLKERLLQEDTVGPSVTQRYLKDKV